jgi:hypothetical protein
VDSPLLIGAALVLFVLAFARTEFALYVMVFSMLLSPEITASAGGLAERRDVTVRTEDFVLLVVGFSWFAKTAVNKELGLVAKTPLNRPIIAYVAVNLMATLLGYLMGSVQTAAGYFYVLKYIEYFVVYFMVVNNLRDRAHAWRLLTAALLTAAIVSVIGLTQIPSGERVSAPFEGESGEPNTLGGYLLFMMAIAGGIALEATRLVIRTRFVALLGLMAVPFAFTLSRASYLGVIPAFLALLAVTTRRRALIAIALVVVVCSPLLLVVAPPSVVNRVLYTFEPEANQPTVRLGKVGLDPSTSARILSLKQALAGWLERPIFGWGVTGHRRLPHLRLAPVVGAEGRARGLPPAGGSPRSGPRAGLHRGHLRAARPCHRLEHVHRHPDHGAVLAGGRHRGHAAGVRRRRDARRGAPSGDSGGGARGALR